MRRLCRSVVMLAARTDCLILGVDDIIAVPLRLETTHVVPPFIVTLISCAFRCLLADC